jgi:hypothetical protein
MRLGLMCAANTPPSGAVTSSAADIGSRAYPVWSASNPRTDCRNTGMQKVSPICPSDIAAVRVVPAVNCELANSLIDSSGDRPAAAIRRSHAKNSASRTSPAAPNTGTTEIDPSVMVWPSTTSGVAARHQPRLEPSMMAKTPLNSPSEESRTPTQSRRDRWRRY